MEKIKLILMSALLMFGSAVFAADDYVIDSRGMHASIQFKTVSVLSCILLRSSLELEGLRQKRSINLARQELLRHDTLRTKTRDAVSQLESALSFFHEK